jgi:putative phosphoesterase
MFVVMSDSHYDRSAIVRIKAKYQKEASAIFHCGDSELASDDEIWEGIRVVAGNCDDDNGYQDFLLQDVEDRKILITHGHLFDVGFGLDRYSYFAEEKGADLALFGHIHRPVAQKINNIIYVNPGSVAQPRGDFQIKMYAVISFENDKVKVSYRDLMHHEIPELQFTL